MTVSGCVTLTIRSESFFLSFFLSGCVCVCVCVYCGVAFVYIFLGEKKTNEHKKKLRTTEYSVVLRSKKERKKERKTDRQTDRYSRDHFHRHQSSV